ncbi:MAG TPA: copper amine oxidase N-terminal domain-containing protein [Candidatus Baltobacteraceae bacterium]
MLVPMRAIFESLGAVVAYDRTTRSVTASTPAHRLSLPIGSRRAVVDGRIRMLDVPARVVALKTYVPLRFVSQALGAIVGYDRQSNVVAIATHSAQSSATPRVGGLSPPAGARVGTGYPSIGASLVSGIASRTGVNLHVDGSDVTSQATFDGETIAYIPRSSLTPGAHTVVFSGDAGGVPFSQTWSFETTVDGAQTGNEPYGVPYQFYNNGSSDYRIGDSMRFTLIAPPGGSAYLQLCGLGFDYPLWNAGSGTYYQANVPVPVGYTISSCEVTAVYTAWNGRQTFVPYPIFIGIYTQPQQPRPQQPGPAPYVVGSPRHTEPVGRRSEPISVPAPAAVRAREAPQPAAPPRPIPVHPIVVHPIVVRPIAEPVEHVPHPRATPRGN